MDIHDDDEKHIVTVFRGDYIICEEKQETDFTSPTEQYFSARKQYREALDLQVIEHSKKRLRPTISNETNESEQRYKHLPEYARASFVPTIEYQAPGSTKLVSGNIVVRQSAELVVANTVGESPGSCCQLDLFSRLSFDSGSTTPSFSLP